CSAGLRRRREALHYSAGRVEGRTKSCERSGRRHPCRKRLAAAQYSSRHADSQSRTEAGQGWTDGAFGGWFGAVGGERTRVRAGDGRRGDTRRGTTSGRISSSSAGAANSVGGNSRFLASLGMTKFVVAARVVGMTSSEQGAVS